MKLPDPKAGGFTPTPAGQHMAVCTRIIDLGTQTSTTQYGVKRQRKIMIGWQIPAHRIEWEKDGVKHEAPMLHTERYTFSTNENARFRQHLESWRGKPFTDADFGKSETAFDVRKLMGVGALMQITHKVEGGNTYANLNAIMLPPGGRDAWPKPEGDMTYLSLDPEEFDPAAYAALSDRLREIIAQSPEYQALFPQGEVKRETVELDDEIPF